MTTFTITPTTTYSLRESAEFGFGGRTSEAFDGVMRNDRGELTECAT